MICQSPRKYFGAAPNKVNGSRISNCSHAISESSLPIKQFLCCITLIQKPHSAHLKASRLCLISGSPGRVLVFKLELPGWIPMAQSHSTSPQALCPYCSGCKSTQPSRAFAWGDRGTHTILHHLCSPHNSSTLEPFQAWSRVINIFGAALHWAGLRAAGCAARSSCTHWAAGGAARTPHHQQWSQPLYTGILNKAVSLHSQDLLG